MNQHLTQETFAPIFCNLYKFHEGVSMVLMSDVLGQREADGAGTT